MKRNTTAKMTRNELAFWIALGLVAGFVYERFGRRMKLARRNRKVAGRRQRAQEILDNDELEQSRNG